MFGTVNQDNLKFDKGEDPNKFVEWKGDHWISDEELPPPVQDTHMP